MNRVLPVLLLAVLPCAAPGQEPAAAPEVLALEQAVALALQNNPRVRNAALQVDRGEENVGSAKAQRFPVFNVEATAGKLVTPVRITVPGGAFGNFPATGPIPADDTVVEAPQRVSGNLSATVAQPLSQLYKIGVGVKANEVARDIDREKLRAERASVVNDVKRLYYGLLQTGSALQAAEEQVKTYRELDRITTEYLARETALISDGLDAKAGLAAQEYRLLSLQNGLATQKEQMNDLLGRDLAHDFTVAPVPEASLEEVDLPAAVSHALEKRPDLQQARLQVDYADADRRLKKADSIPELSLAFSYYSFFNVELLPRNIATVGLQLKWKPFDWSRGKQIAEKTLQLEQARTSAREAENQVRLDVAANVRKLQESRLQLEAARLARESAREKLRVATNRYKEQAALLKDVLQAQAALGDANAQYDQALLSFWIAKADLERALGKDE